MAELPAPGRSRALALLAFALVLGMSPWFSATAVIPQLRDEWDLSRDAGAWLTIAVQLGFVAGALLSSLGNVADVLPPRLVILGGSAGAAAANLGVAASDGAETAIPLRALTGFFLAGVYPPAFKLMATWFRRGRAFALGTLAGAIAVGSAAPHFVNGVGGLEWRTVVYATSALTLAGGVLAWRLVPEGPYPFPRAVFDPRQVRRVLRNRGVRLASLGYFGHMWELFAMWAWFLAFLRDGHGAGGTQAAYTTFAVIAAGGVGCVAGGALAERLGRAETAAAALAVSGACALTIGLLVDAPTWLVVLVGLVWGFAVIPDSALFSTLVTEHADQSYVGTALSLQLALGFALTVATIWLVPVLADAVGWEWTFAFLAPGPALGVVAMLRLRAGPQGGEDGRRPPIAV
ncbi:MAG TPA: MFS transporter [Gaiellaceae bacterium]|nr:MFS transporter [Gaiellaceae bacterium]